MLSCEILSTADTAWRGKQMLAALSESAEKAGVDVRVSPHYIGESQWLMLYGAGGWDRLGPFKQHLASGRRVICWDLGYWDRERMLRCSIDSMHPEQWLWKRDLPASRFEASGIQLRNEANAAGPIVFAKMGRKSVALFGDWDKRALGALKARFPDRQIVVREKPSKISQPDAPKIAAVLRGASLVVTRHSNVAIDAIVAGVPFECECGAASAFKGDRIAFLQQLAWFQWHAGEAAQAWKFLRQTTGE